MDRIKPWGWQASAAPYRSPRQVRVAAAWALRAASVALDRLAQRIAATDDHVVALSRRQIEFHAESGAPEGALYVDGILVGRIDGIRRL